MVDGFDEHVELEIDETAFGEGGEGGDGVGVRGDPAGEVGGGSFCDGEGDAVDGDGAAGDEESGGVFRDGDDEAVVLADGFVGEDGSGLVDVALDEVAAESGSDGEGAFEIDGGARLEGAEVGDVEGLAEEVERDGVGGGVDDGEAATVDGNAFAEGEIGGEGDAGECEPRAAEGGGEGGDLGGGFDDAGEHRGDGAREEAGLNRNWRGSGARGWAGRISSWG